MSARWLGRSNVRTPGLLDKMDPKATTERPPPADGASNVFDINLPVLMEATEQDPTSNLTSTADPAARESIQRALDQCVEEGQLHRLHQWATKLNELCHGEKRDS